jgi:NAD(P) transhydrogenase subunit alpha
MATNNITAAAGPSSHQAAGRRRVGATRGRQAPRRRLGPLIITPMLQSDLWSMLFVFMLATFVGFQVIQNVSRLLHTPLMSLTNAISAIAVVGSILIAGERESEVTTILGTVAVAASMTNIVSGFLITDRMLKMFRDKGPK